jgi:hypothetical protein
MPVSTMIASGTAMSASSIAATATYESVAPDGKPLSMSRESPTPPPSLPW